MDRSECERVQQLGGVGLIEKLRWLRGVMATVFRGRMSGAVVLLICATVLTGCEATSTALDDQKFSAVGAKPAPAGDIKLAAGDRIKINVFGDDRISGEFLVDAAGQISLPLVGTIDVAGKTRSAFEIALRNKLKGEFVKDPKVSVAIVSLRPFYILGAVEKPGEYPYRSGLNVMTAVAIAGGNTYRASTSKVLIQRAGDTVMSEVAISAAVPVYPGDLVKVPERAF